MNLEHIKELIRFRISLDTDTGTEEDFRDYSAFLQNPDLREYLLNCLAPVGYEASGLRILTRELLDDENLGMATPGRYLFPLGFLVIGTTIDGNVVCVKGDSGRVYWGDHTAFVDQEISFQHPDTGDWFEGPLTSDNILHALIPLSDSLELFLVELLNGKLETRLIELG